MGRIEIDFFPKVDPMKQIKYWAVSKEAAYYHVGISCLRKRRPSLVLARNKLKLSESVEIDKNAEISLGLEWFVDDIKISLFRNDLILVT